jgi:hypothetical protein
MKLIAPWLQRILLIVGYGTLTALLVWSILALWFGTPPLPRILARITAVVWLAGLLFMFFGWSMFGLRKFLKAHVPWLPDWVVVGLPRTAAISVALAGFLIIRLLWTLKQPSDDRVWVPDQARVPVVQYGQSSVTIHNFRNTLYRTRDDFDVRWETRTFALDQISSLDIMIEPFMEWQGISHFLMSFGFEDGEHVCVSVEARVEETEEFGILPALFKEYELVYVVGDERDLIHQRVNFQGHPVHLYPVRVDDREQLRALFVLVLNHAAKLKKRPQFYNTLIRNCTNTQLRHIEYLTASDFPWLDYRLILPGYVDELLHAIGGIDNNRPLQELRAASRINERAVPPEGLSGPGWSARIRGQGL